MANVEWNIDFTLRTPEGDLALNAESGDRFVLLPPKCSMGALDRLRFTFDDVPQGDGGMPHLTWRPHYLVKLGLQLWIGDGIESSIPACGSDRRRMWDELMLHLNSLVRPSDADADAGNTQLIWTPSGDSSTDDRMVNRIRLVELSPPLDDGEGAVEAEMQFYSPYPYAMDVTEITDIFGIESPTVTNPGTTEFYPVFRVPGPIEAFTLENSTSGLQFNYDGLQDGAQPILGGDYAEIDTFRNTIYLNGNGANLKPGIDIPSSDFWTLLPGDNDLIFDTPTTMLWQAAWI